MPDTDIVIIGAGHAGLAMSRCLSDRGVPHVVLERGLVGERWRSARWDSFRLLTPNWLSRLPGWSYAGPDPDGYMTAGDFVGYLCDYATSFDAPVRPNTPVSRVECVAGGFAVHTEPEVWSTRNVVVATGYHSRAKIPDLAAGLSPDIARVTPSAYRSPTRLPDGGVLVVGASASGVQIAHELAVAGRRVVLAVGGHTRLPRRYRDRDILWWLERIGFLDRVIDEDRDTERAPEQPSLQLVGTPDARRVDLDVLQRAGVRLAGRVRVVTGTTVMFADDLADTMGAAEKKLRRVLGDIDAYAGTMPGPAPAPPDPPPLVRVPPALSKLDLARAGVASVIWATGYRPAYPWLKVPVLDPRGRIRHHRGLTDVQGLFAIGMRFQHRRNSTFIDGARHDAAHLADRITAGSMTVFGG